MIKSLCVSCGSNNGSSPDYVNGAKTFGKILAENKIKLIFGGANVGLMGTLADSVLQNGGEVAGVITKFLNSKVGHPDLSELYEVETMHERKAKMFSLSDGYVALPGGYGTLEETFEVLTWGQLGFHKKPVGLLNINGYYDSLVKFADHSCSEMFLKKEHRELLLISNDPKDLISKLKSFKPKQVGKWISPRQKKRHPHA